MKKEGILSSILLSILPYIIFFLWGFGVIHSYKKHSKIDFVVSFFPPWGVFRGAESFWHKTPDKYAKIDWNKRLEGDGIILLTLLAAAPETGQQTEMNDVLEDFSKRVLDYPKDKIEYLKDAAKMYYRFLDAVSVDMQKFCKETIDGKVSYQISDWSVHCKPIMDSLLSIYKITEIRAGYDEMNSSLEEFKNQVQNNTLSNEDADTFLRGMDKLDKANKTRIQRIYRMIFNESIPNADAIQSADRNSIGLTEYVFG